MNLMAAAVIAMTLLASVVLAQSAGVAGNWEGKIVSPQGERPMSATFKKEGDGYTGTISQMMRDITLQDVKVDGNKVTAKANIDTPSGNHYDQLQVDARWRYSQGHGRPGFWRTKHHPRCRA
jgi:hypothetical protein